MKTHQNIPSKTTSVGVRASNGYVVMLYRGKGIIKVHISHPKVHVSLRSIYHCHLSK
jgi:hypothetical protein